MDKFLNEKAENSGDLVIAVISEVRREKAERHLPLNAPIKKLMVYAGSREMAEAVKEGQSDIAGTCKITELDVVVEKGSGREICQYPDLCFSTEY
jgi:valyl-tRNA synthetase